jgi:hypothetical protein
LETLQQNRALSKHLRIELKKNCLHLPTPASSLRIGVIDKGTSESWVMLDGRKPLALIVETPSVGLISRYFFAWYFLTLARVFNGLVLILNTLGQVTLSRSSKSIPVELQVI